APADERQTVELGASELSQNLVPPALMHASTVQGLQSSQSAFELQLGAVITQSAGSEFGCWDGYEQTSMSSPPPKSAVARQHETTVSSVVQFVPLHLLAGCPAPAKGSVVDPAVQVEWQAT